SAPKPPPGRHYKVTFAGESGPISSYVGPLGSGAASGFKIGDYTFVSILPRAADIPSVIKALAEEGFRFSGEKTFFTPEGKKTLIMGWASYSRLDRITKNPLVLRTAVESKPSGSQFRARIRFTLRAPGGENSAVFVEDFVRNLGSSAGFSAENVSRVPAASGSSKFTAFEVTGSIPLEMIGSVSMSPFVAAVELQDQSL
ncbi:MAG TPA: hypothetical protein PL037_00845, partial [Elusimicrobiales bacterium]|nr:hypothetical protein [Elusimicrobiales bacterium]